MIDKNNNNIYGKTIKINLSYILKKKLDYNYFFEIITRANNANFICSNFINII